jgi:ribosomal protein S18 acetylase RimI-like enzyme
MEIALRPASNQDFDYCRRVYFAGISTIIEDLRLHRPSQEASFKEQWKATQVRIITLDRWDIGWLQSFIEDDTLFIAQLFIDVPFQRRGIGAEVMHRLIGEANRANLAVRLNVVKINPAVRLYKRLGFRVVREDDRKFYMKRDQDMDAFASS